MVELVLNAGNGKELTIMSSDGAGIESSHKENNGNLLNSDVG